MVLCKTWAALIVFILATACSPVVDESCAVTLPNGSTPPGESPSDMHHGNGELWTALWPDGELIFDPEGPGEILPDGSLAMKFPWWRAEGVQGELLVEGRRLDGEAPPLKTEIPEGYGDRGFQASGLIFPLEGCWEVVGRSGEAALTFVVLVEKAGD